LDDLGTQQFSPSTLNGRGHRSSRTGRQATGLLEASSGRKRWGTL